MSQLVLRPEIALLAPNLLVSGRQTLISVRKMDGYPIRIHTVVDRNWRGKKWYHFRLICLTSPCLGFDAGALRRRTPQRSQRPPCYLPGSSQCGTDCGRLHTSSPSGSPRPPQVWLIPASATQYSQHLIRPIGDDAPDTFVNQQTHPTRVVHRPDIDVHASFVRSIQEGRTGEIDSQ